MTFRSTLIAAAGATLLAPAVAGAQTASPNLKHIVNIPYEKRYGETANYGTDIEFATIGGKRHALAGSYRNGMQIFDISDPAAPRLVGVYDCAISQGDVQVFTRADKPNRTYATYTADATPTAARAESECYEDATKLGFSARNSNGTGKQGTFILDVTAPANPRTVSFVEVPKGSHNQTVHPSGMWMYNSNSELITNIAASSIEIIDIRDLSAPRIHGTFELQKFPLSLGNDSHDITFSADGTRAYSAALSHEEILDTTDPSAPKRVGTIVDPAINVFHQSDPITIGDRRVLVIEDEFAGAVGTNQCPNGGVHFYDITGAREANPVKLGYWNVDQARTATGSCTAHVFRLHDKEDLMTIAFYNGGVSVVDLEGVVGPGIGAVSPAGPKQIAFSRFANSNAWSAKTPFIEESGDFHLYANDITRGLDVFAFDAQAAQTTNVGTWDAGPTDGVTAQVDLRGYRTLCLLQR